ncbi:hypothetical protein [Phenylobacterium sp.]|jgi:hypothetical protein|uniref:hypothetical protein n=1 Tax=Phenylobacterium sp. TaxID=1871053 RepID=UPI002ED974AA
MNANIERLKLIFIGLFVVAAIGVGIWQFWWVMPAQKCEKEQKKWWDPVERVCATPVLVSDITGRVITDEKALAEAKKAIGRTAVPKGPAPAPKN